MPGGLPLPRNILRYTFIFCLAGWGTGAILVASRVASHSVPMDGIRALALQLFFAALAFAFFYAQYAAVEHYGERDLDLRLGYLQSFGCLVFLLWGLGRPLAAILGSATQLSLSGSSDSALIYICSYGEMVFLANVFWSYLLRDGVPPKHVQVPVASSTAPATAPSCSRAAASASTLAQSSNWSDSPVRLFGIAAGFFMVMGLLFVVIGPLVTRMPVLWKGNVSHISAGYLWMPLALPFAAFALIYSWAGSTGRRNFDRSATRIHFICTLLMVLECARIYVSWASTSYAAVRPPLAAGNFFGVFAFSALSLGALAWNFRASGRISGIA